MSIKVTYKIELSSKSQNKPLIDEIMDQFCKDSSWGTHASPLHAIKETISEDGNWRELEPNYSVTLSEKNLYLIDVYFKTKQFNFHTEGLAHFIGTIAGDILSNRSFKSVSVEDIVFPKSYVDDFFPHPNLGVDALRNDFLSETLDNSNRPFLAYSIKPRLGLNKLQFKELLENISNSRADIIEDDERIIDPEICSFQDRLDIISNIDFNKGTKYSINVTFPLQHLKDKVQEAYDSGIRVFKYDVMVGSFDGLLYLRKIIKMFKEECALTVFPDVYGLNFRNLSRRVVLKLSRLCGADIIYGGSPKWDWSRYGYLANFEEFKNNHRILLEDIDGHDINSTLPTITHDIQPTYLEYTIYHLRKRFNNHLNYAFFIGGGISAYPGGNEVKDVIDEYITTMEEASEKDLSEIRSWKEIPQIVGNAFQADRDLKKEFQRLNWPSIKRIKS
ncbi:RuBisCO large subunit C-terminal-like domain-containing protein [Fodinibius saliphilus]|uniref:RuBisCO large subunit C-terminal-like domain-containing protein n=1 Tax=Fodinibius saliphilus TaxID=1920650 RepID=UPI001108EC69|nr:RuBisCO large subunit C-terminal-like domain-containing protein [Fodinibius saliphilus]